MKHLKYSGMAVLLIVTIIIGGCSMHPKIKANDSYARIKPVAPLPEYERMKVPHNLSIVVENVADMNNSYKNRVRLYVNKYEIEPDEIFNYKSSYKYNMKLQPGIYEIKALYYAHTGWKESSFTIKPRDRVKIYLNKKATLNVTLKKNHWGAPVDKVTYFELDYEDIDLNKSQ